MALFLGSDASEFVSGQAMIVDGAATSAFGALRPPQGQRGGGRISQMLDQEFSGPPFQMKKPR